MMLERPCEILINLPLEGDLSFSSVSVCEFLFIKWVYEHDRYIWCICRSSGLNVNVSAYSRLTLMFTFCYIIMLAGVHGIFISGETQSFSVRATERGRSECDETDSVTPSQVLTSFCVWFFTLKWSVLFLLYLYLYIGTCVCWFSDEEIL